MKQILLFQILLIFLITFLNSFQFKFKNENEFDWIQKQILIANDGKVGEIFGYSLDMKANYCVIGSPYSTVGNNSQQGKAYIYENNGTNWDLIQILIANDGKASDYFGTSVSISNDGKFILIGSPYAKVGNNSEQGKAYIFQNNGTNWNQKQILIANDGNTFDNFGLSISISNDDSLILIGSPYSNVGNNIQQGKAYIFQNNGTFWNQYQILIANDGKDYDFFAISVSISNDFALIGAYWADVGNNIQQGKAYIFQNNGTFWNQHQILIANDGGFDDQFGRSVSFSNDSSLILISAPNSNVGENEKQGKAYIFQNNGTFWNQKQILIANDGNTFDQFGLSISISNDSSLILIGSPYAPVFGNNTQGKAYIFQNNGTFWNQIQILIANDGEAGNFFGTNNIDQGKAYIFEPF
ncbi:hypothetical protein M0811_06434 [Anaeramoeba ignava]|uniref:Uncharacterized protein n=1 Tax=Anaeramoeba ignava TaxID=1746090 RepID=A0A9Q0RDT2_ANAIG|nr:hypothetical protein M0811_06434 [Anaeramoeba ignava]